MRKHIRSTSLPVFALSLVVLGTMLPGALSDSWALAADDCVAKPNAPAAAGQHWWYRTDRATRRKCWFLGPQDKAAAAQKADRQEQAAAPAAEPEAQPASTQDANQDSSLASGARSDNGVRPFAVVTQEGVPFLVDWSDLLQQAGIVNAKDNALTDWADDKAARTAWAMQDQPDQAPVESQAGKDDARAPQPAAAEADIASAPAATPAGLPVTTIAAILIAGVMGPAIFSIVRARRRRNSPRKVDTRATGAATGAYAGTFPAFLQRQDARSVPPGQGYEQEYGQASGEEYGRGYGGEEELRRILHGVQRRAA